MSPWYIFILWISLATPTPPWYFLDAEWAIDTHGVSERRLILRLVLRGISSEPDGDVERSSATSLAAASGLADRNRTGASDGSSKRKPNENSERGWSLAGSGNSCGAGDGDVPKPLRRSRPVAASVAASGLGVRSGARNGLSKRNINGAGGWTAANARGSSGDAERSSGLPRQLPGWAAPPGVDGSLLGAHGSR